MCGIVGIITRRPQALLDGVLDDMNRAIRHRGPDDAGSHVDVDAGIGIAMRRLSILDIAGGHQPMWDEGRDHAVVFNGEIYNAAHLREQLVAHGHTFASDHSDTEVLVHGYEQWGDGLMPRLNGMFAFAIWDVRARRLVVARDRMGEKPLYIAPTPGGHAIASELKALLRHPEVSRDLDPVGVEQFLAFDFTISPRTLLRGVQKLPAGHYAHLHPDRIEVRPYWQPRFDGRADAAEPHLVRRLDLLLDGAVRSRMIADVPVGLFLSGGLDSTSIGYYMTRHSSNVMSFSIGFDDREHDESAYSETAARHLGTRHHLEMLSQDRVRDLVPRVADLLDDPIADRSILPTFLLSQVTSSHVKVALGGDGSDELLMGYGALRPLKLTWALDVLPQRARTLVAAGASRLPTHLGPVPVRGRRIAELGAVPPRLRLLQTRGAFTGDARRMLHPQLRAHLTDSVLTEVHDAIHGTGIDRSPPNATIACYLRTYLQEDILVKVDRASMAASLEVRAPFLDPDLIDFVNAVPAGRKMRGFTGKRLLRQLMRGRIPDAIIDRPKRGFDVPMSAWLRGPLEELLRDHLSPDRLRDGGEILDPGAVSRLLEAHRARTADCGGQLWSLLLLQLWRERWVGSAPTVGAGCA